MGMGVLVGRCFILKYFPRLVFLCPSDRRGERRKGIRGEEKGGGGGWDWSEVIVPLLGGDRRGCSEPNRLEWC